MHNQAIARYVKNTDEDKKIIETDGRIVQMVDPIFKHPSQENKIFSRAHFFAPYKYFLGQKLNTPSFNIMVIWMMTGLLYVLLYVDGLRKIIDALSFKRKKGLSKF